VCGKMNVTSLLPLANENSSEKTKDWNYTGSRPGSGSWGEFSDVEWLTYVLAVLQCIIFAVGTVGNLMVLVVLVWRRSRSQVGTQLFVGSLAVADLGLMFSSVWVEIHEALQNNWVFGSIPCKLRYMWQYLTMTCSVWTMAALSIDRYLLRIQRICTP